jgi:hypothetical protein
MNPADGWRTDRRWRSALAAWRNVLREPLVQFLIFGSLLFICSHWMGGGAGPGSNRISITPGLVEHLASGFARTWQRPPTDAELKGLVDDYIKEEIATREATAMGLDRDDAVIRRRLRQKLEFLVEDATMATPPTDAELETWIARHPEVFHREPEVAFRQVYVSPERRGSAALADAERLLAALRAKGPAADGEGLGDPSMLPAEFAREPRREVARFFGEEFATDLMQVEPGTWTGPIESAYGLHLVLVLDRIDRAMPALAEIRPLVEREVLAEKRRNELDLLYEKLLAKYTVNIEMPKALEAAQTDTAAAAASSENGPR